MLAPISRLISYMAPPLEAGKVNVVKKEHQQGAKEAQVYMDSTIYLASVSSSYTLRTAEN